MAETKTETISGPLHAALGQHVSNLIWLAQQQGIPTDEAVCVAVAVCADYARVMYGNDYLQQLADVILKRAEYPTPEVNFERTGPLDG